MKELSYLTPENGHKLDHFTSSNTQFDANVNIKKFYFQRFRPGRDRRPRMPWRDKR